MSGVAIRKNKKKRMRLLLLADGYDELNQDDRIRVSGLLRHFRDTGCGQFVLTCRLFYDVVDLPATVYTLDGFTDRDCRAFMAAFFQIFRAQADVDELVKILTERGFVDFLRNPLLVTLLCILKTGPLSMLPRHTIGLLIALFRP